MLPEIFVIGLSIVLASLFLWGFRVLPNERWQVIGCLLSEKSPDGGWKGLNLTYYGFFNATAYLLAAVVFFILMGALSVPPVGAMILLVAILGICMPASGLIAFWVEGKANTFTVGGASFIGLIASPWIVLAMNWTLGSRLGFSIPVLSVLAAISIAYALGEGVGRLACISFGCCYGKPLSECSPLIRRIFRGRGFIFSGATNKIAYADHLDGSEVVPIQALTALLLTGSGLFGCYFFLKGFHFTTFAVLLVVTQAWRILSEFLRADYRGKGRISAYQIMALIAIVYTFVLLTLFPTTGGKTPDLREGLLALWKPDVILFFEMIWGAAFIYTGRSRMTGASVRLHVVRERI